LSPNLISTLPPFNFNYNSVSEFQFDISCTMPSTTEREKLTEALHKALLFNLITMTKQDTKSSDSSSSTSNNSSSKSEDEEGPSQVEDYLHSIAALCTDHYYNTREFITKTDNNLYLLLED
jgi:hypothetical protein